jgi:hypothetical protein
VPAELDAVEPGDRDVTGDAQARVLQRRHGPDRRLVIGAHQGARHPAGGDDLLGDPPTALGGEIAVVGAHVPGRGPAEPVVPARRVRRAGRARDEAQVGVAVHVR